MSSNISLTIDRDQIAWIELDQPDKKVNILSTPFMLELDQILKDLPSKNPAAVIFSSKKEENFIAGANIEEIAGINDAKDGEAKAEAGKNILKQLEALKVPTIAAINGPCIGGGLELILYCKYRIASDSEKIKLSSPEVKLGILPGWGGTQRLPRLIGPSEALDMMLAGHDVNSKKAKKIGLVDQIVPRSILKQAAARLAIEIIEGKGGKYLKNRGPKSFLEKVPFGRSLIFKTALRTVMSKTRGLYPAPLKIIEAVKNGYRMKKDDALKMESRMLGELTQTEVFKNLVSISRQLEKVRKSTGVEDESIAPGLIKKVGVVGAGVMGGGISQLLCFKDVSIRLKDINNESLLNGFLAAWNLFSDLIKRKRLSPCSAKQKMDFISGTTDYSGFGNTDLVIEAVVENLDIKKKVFHELEQKTQGRAILASNTSALPITELAKSTEHPEKVIGMHFFNPVHRMPLVEIIKTASTSAETIATTFATAKKLGKTPVVVNDCAGFLINRILVMYMNEAVLILEEGGADVLELDSIILDFGMPMGPFSLADEVGIDVGYKVALILHDAYGERFAPVRLIEKYYNAKRFGKKTGKGIFNYQGKKKRLDRKFISDFISTKHQFKITKTELLDRMLLVMINEASRCLEEGIVKSPSDLDLAMIMGTGFPPYTGGLLKYADKAGIQNIVNKLNQLRPGRSRFEPSKYLINLAGQGKGFYY